MSDFIQFHLDGENENRVACYAPHEAIKLHIKFTNHIRCGNLEWLDVGKKRWTEFNSEREFSTFSMALNPFIETFDSDKVTNALCDSRMQTNKNNSVREERVA